MVDDVHLLNEVAHLNDTLQEVSIAIATLADLHKTTKLRLDAVQKRRRVLHQSRTVMDLPDELLADIFISALGPLSMQDIHKERIYEGLPTMKQVLALSHVSRRFLQVTLATPELWTCITQLSPIPLVEAFLERSGERDIVVAAITNTGTRSSRLDMKVHAKDASASCNALREHLHCLQGIMFPLGTWVPPALECLLSEENVQFPALRRLEFTPGSAEGFGTPATEDGSWAHRTPVLSTVIVSPIRVNAFASKSVTKLHLDGKLRSSEFPGVVEGIIMFTQLEDLTLDLWGSESAVDVALAHLTSRVRLVSLKTLDVRTAHNTANHQSPTHSNALSSQPWKRSS